MDKTPKGRRNESPLILVGTSVIVKHFGKLFRPLSF